MSFNKEVRRQKIRYRIRKKIQGTAEKPRLAVRRSNSDIYVQLIDDKEGVTLAAASSLEKGKKKTKVNKTEQAIAVGKKIAELATSKGISEVSFDRGGYLYHGRVKSLADAAREGGLKF
jgi:large subunit ribosomal protein L18